jgi:transcriptional regulator with XRE-family HTH domain
MDFREKFCHLIDDSKIVGGVDDLSVKSGVSRGYLYNVRKGRYLPKPDKLTKVLEALKVDERTRVEMHTLLQETRNYESRMSIPEERDVLGNLKRTLIAKIVDFTECTLGLRNVPHHTYKNAVILEKGWLANKWREEVCVDDELAKPEDRASGQEGKKVVLFAYEYLPDMNVAYGRAVQALVQQKCEAALLVVSEPYDSDRDLPGWVGVANKRFKTDVKVVSNWDVVGLLVEQYR